MLASNRFALFSLIVTLLLLVSLAAPIAALADDDPPPPDPTTETETPPETEESTTSSEDEAPPAESSEVAPPTDATEAAQPADIAEQASPTESAEEPAPEGVSLPDVLEQAPEGTEVVILDEDGEVLPLATEEAVEILVTSDPMWCPAGATPGDPDCSPPQDSMTDLIAWLTTNNPDAAGTIWIEDDYDSGSNPDDAGLDFTLDGSSPSLTNMVNHALTIQGGWSGGNNTDVDPGSPSEFNGYLWITNWAGDVTLNDILVSGASDIGILVQTEGDVSVDNVSSEDNDLEGMVIEAEGEVTVHESNFPGNGWAGYEDGDFEDDENFSSEWEEYRGASGLVVRALGNVTLNQVFAEENAMHGADLYSGDGSVEVSDSEFYDNGYGGYFYVSTYANEGADDFNDSFDVEFNGGSGLYVETDSGGITISEIVAAFNARHGAELRSASGDVWVSDSDFELNGGFGKGESDLFLEASEDEFYHDLYMQYVSGGGLSADTGGSLTLSEVYASDNAGYGAELYASGPIDISNSEFYYNGWWNGIFDEACLNGVCGCPPDCASDLGFFWLEHNLYENEIFEDANVLCTGDFGADFYALVFDPCEDAEYLVFDGPNFYLGAGVGGDYYETDGGEYFGGYEIEVYGGAGLIAGSEGGIALENVEAVANGAFGAELYNNSLDAIEISESEFSENGLFGDHYISESFSEYYSSESDTGFSYSVDLDFSYSDGLNAENNGDVTLVEVVANENGSDGADLESDAGLVQVQLSEFNENGVEPIIVGGVDGLFGTFLCLEGIFGFELCDALEVSASGLSFYLDASPEWLGIYVDLSSGTGLEVDEAATGLTLDEVTANYNGGFGADLETDENAVITNSEFSFNGYQFSIEVGAETNYLCACDEEDLEFFISAYASEASGLAVDAGNDITLDNVAANSNALYGAELYSGALDSVAVSNSQFNENGDNALSDLLCGFIGLCDPQDGFGRLNFEDTDESGEDGPTVETFEGSGLYIETSGNITIENVDGWGNANDGAELLSGGNARICDSSFGGNGDYGVDAAGVNGSLTLSDVTYGVNGSGDYDFNGVAVTTTGVNCLPVQVDDPEDATGGGTSLVIPVTGGEQITCEGATSGSVSITLPNGDHVVLPCPINDFAILNTLLQDGLLGELGGDHTFRSAMDIGVIRDEQPVEVIEGAMTVSFVIPDGVDPESLAILWWNGSEWVELGAVEAEGLQVFDAGHATDDGYFEALVNFTGTFVLVSQ